MQIAQLVLDYVKTFAPWPLVVTFALVMFRRPIHELMSRLAKVKAGPVEAAFSEALLAAGLKTGAVVQEQLAAEAEGEHQPPTDQATQPRESQDPNQSVGVNPAQLWATYKGMGSPVAPSVSTVELALANWQALTENDGPARLVGPAWVRLEDAIRSYAKSKGVETESRSWAQMAVDLNLPPSIHDSLLGLRPLYHRIRNENLRVSSAAVASFLNGCEGLRQWFVRHTPPDGSSPEPETAGR